MPRSSPAEAPSVLIAAVSGRALAAAARRAGLVPLVADFFADADTLEMAQACVKLTGALRRGFLWTALAPALDRLAREAPSPPIGLVYGAGFENRTELLARIGERWRLIGNDADTVERVKDPERFFATLARLGIPHPRTATDRPLDLGRDWLSKRKGGAGGSHVTRPADGCGKNHIAPGEPVPNARARAANRYFQEIVPGHPLSTLFVSNGREARVLGFSEQWTAPRRGARWRYGGAAQPADLSSRLEQALTTYVETASAAFGLKGLGSADFLVDAEVARLIEINPRPGATLDIFDADAQPLLHLHLRAVLEGLLPDGPLHLPEARAAAIVYASSAVTVPIGMQWPEWTRDRPKPGERIDKNRPICTVWARARTGPEAKRLVEERKTMILMACANHNGGTR